MDSCFCCAVSDIPHCLLVINLYTISLCNSCAVSRQKNGTDFHVNIIALDDYHPFIQQIHFKIKCLHIHKKNSMENVNIQR